MTITQSKNESEEDVILDLIEDHLELNPKFKKELGKAAKEVKEGKTIPLIKVLEAVELWNRSSQPKNLCA